MSVLQCNRHGCPNIMCDRYSERYGYICRDCFDELVNLGLGVDIQEFMDSDMGSMFNDERNWAWDIYNDEFKWENDNYLDIKE